RIQVLFEGMEKLTFEFYENDKWVKQWEKPGLPAAVKVTIETEALGELHRIFVLIDNMVVK
ncbi:MAG: type II secretion system protein J, partial [Alteromonadaceae bacterium]